MNKEDTAACVIGHQGGNVNLYQIENLNSHNCDNTSSLLQLRISLGLNNEQSKQHRYVLALQVKISN